jgi:F-box domain
LQQKINKKIKIIMNPLVRISSELHELIFQHFDYADVLSASNVSKYWYEDVGKSKISMSKIKLKFWKSTDKNQTERIIKILKVITRDYQHLSIDCRFDKTLSLEFWKLFTSHLASTLISLKIKSIRIDNPSCVEIKKLKELKLVYVPTSIRNLLLKSITSLKRITLKFVSPLNWKCPKTDSESIDCIKRFIENNEKLEDLEVYGAVQYSLLFDEDLSRSVNFRLNSLKIKNDMRLALIPERIEENVINFFSTQCSSLQKIFIDVCRPNVIQFIFNKMTQLKSVQIETVMTEFHAKELNLNLNEHVTDLSIPYVNKHEDVRNILEMTPNLCSLFVAHLSVETMEYIAFSLKKLNTLKYRYDEIDCEELYERLKNQNPEEVNQNIDMIVDYEYS